MKISVTILTKNNEGILARTLDSLVDFDEVLVYDTGSSDRTASIARQYKNVTFREGPLIGFGPTHNVVSSLARNDWILSVDSDEVMSGGLQKEIFALSPEENTVYSCPRHNFYNGKFIKGCGWYPDRQYRLYNRKQTRFTDALVHEQIITKNMCRVSLKNPIFHYSYRSVSDFLEKMEKYSSLFAEQYAGRKKSSPCKAALHGMFAFFKSYILKKGLFLGYEGFLISAYNGHTAFYKYMKLYEANTKIKES